MRRRPGPLVHRGLETGDFLEVGGWSRLCANPGWQGEDSSNPHSPLSSPTLGWPGTSFQAALVRRQPKHIALTRLLSARLHAGLMHHTSVTCLSAVWHLQGAKRGIPPFSHPRILYRPQHPPNSEHAAQGCEPLGSHVGRGIPTRGGSSEATLHGKSHSHGAN